jgi:endonuclease YncB( thermonuclease family)
VVRVIDANTVQLSKNGFVTLAAIQSPSSYNNNNNSFMSTYPSTKLKQLLPLNTKVQIIKWTDEEYNNGKKRSLIFTTRYNKDKTNQLLFVNSELVKAGMAKPSIRGQAKAEQLIPDVTQMLQDLNQQAKSRKVGIYQTCNAGVTSTSTNIPPLPSEKINIGMEKSSFDLDSQFEPMENSVETQWGDDGGKQILVPRMKENIFSPSNPPPNPGDSKQCYDFESFEDALQWYERYQQYYGDVANLDRDGDGIPCSGLPHTKNSERYRVKKKYNNNPRPVKTITRTQ